MEPAAVFLISTQAALFGPSKYGLLPELLPEKKLSWGNGVIELGTFLASITAMMAAGFLALLFSRPPIGPASFFLRSRSGLRPASESRACPPPILRASFPIRWAILGKQFA